MTSAGVTWDENQPGIKADADEYKKSMDDVKESIYKRIGDDLIGPTAIREIYNEMRDSGLADQLGIPEDLGVKDGVSFDKDFHIQLAPSAQPWFEVFKEDKALTLGREEALDNQQLFFETAKKMLHEKAFQDNPIGERYIDQFVKGIDIHLDGNVRPNIFETNANRIATPPRPSP